MNIETDGIDIQPGVSSYGLFSNYNYKAWTALGEFVDNSVSSWLANRVELEKLHGDGFVCQIEILFADKDEIMGGEIVIKDNAAGISAANYPRAFRLGEPPADLGTISQYGVGMKAAACWFAKHWSVHTSAMFENTARHLDWDTKLIIAEQRTRLKPICTPARLNEHFTKIVLHNLIHCPSGSMTISKIKSHLSKMYRRYIEEGQVQISWNGDPLRVERCSVLCAPVESDLSENPRTWSIDLDFVIPGSTQRVLGKAWLLETMDRQETALNFFWRKRLIKGNVEPHNRPEELFGKPNSFRTGRLCVELDLDSFLPTSDKQGINFESVGASEEQLIEELKIQLNKPNMPMIWQGENYRSCRNADSEQAYSRELKMIAKEVSKSVTGAFKNALEVQPNKTPEGQVDDFQNPAHFSEVMTIEYERVRWEVTMEVGESSPEIYWLGKAQGVEMSSNGMINKLTVRLGANHPFIRQYLTDDTYPMMMRFAIGLALAEFLSAQSGEESHPVVIRELLNVILREALCSKKKGNR